MELYTFLNKSPSKTSMISESPELFWTMGYRWELLFLMPSNMSQPEMVRGIWVINLLFMVALTLAIYISLRLLLDFHSTFHLHLLYSSLFF